MTPKLRAEPDTINIGGEPDTINIGGEPDSENSREALHNKETLALQESSEIPVLTIQKDQPTMITTQDSSISTKSFDIQPATAPYRQEPVFESITPVEELVYNAPAIVAPSLQQEPSIGHIDKTMPQIALPQIQVMAYENDGTWTNKDLEKNVKGDFIQKLHCLNPIFRISIQ